MFIICIVAAAAAGLRGASRVRGARAPPAARPATAATHDVAVRAGRVAAARHYVLR
jgi:hypothetical protein